MFEAIIKEFGDLDVDFENSFYCGDGAGRILNDTFQRKDYSSADIKFALNCGLKFEYPENIFQKY